MLDAAGPAGRVEGLPTRMETPFTETGRRTPPGGDSATRVGAREGIGA